VTEEAGRGRSQGDDETADGGHGRRRVPDPAATEDNRRHRDHIDGEQPNRIDPTDGARPARADGEPGHVDGRARGDRPEDDQLPDAATRLKDEARTRDAADLRRRQLDAEANLSGHIAAGRDMHVRGDVFIGHKALGEAWHDGVVVDRVPDAVLDEIGRSFVPPPVYGRLRERLAESHVAVLHARPGWGRTTTGLAVLGGLCPAGVWGLSPDTDLRNLRPAKLQEGGGHLLEIRALDRIAPVKVPHVEALATACAERGVRLLVTLDANLAPAQAVLDEFGVDGGAPADADTVLRRHLARHVEDDAGDLLDDPAVKGFVASVLDTTETADTTLGMRELVELAGSLARVATGEATVDEVRARWEERSSQSITRWLSELPDLADQAFVVALAAFNGSPYLTVSRLARRLERRIRRALDDDAAGERRPFFGPSRDERLDIARAEVFASDLHTRYGSQPVEGVRFCNRAYPRQVLRQVWIQHDVARDIVVDWLRDVGDDADPDVRTKAATAIGMLATLELEWIRRQVLLPWADSPDLRHRESAVTALGLPSREPELAGAVARMLREWVGERRRPQRRRTAIAALGTRVGGFTRAETLAMLRAVAADDDMRVTYALCDSVVTLLRDALPEVAEAAPLLRALTRWSGKKAPPVRRRSALHCFLYLAVDVTHEDPADGTAWPALLWLAGQDPDTRAAVTTLWRRALRTPHVALLAPDVLIRWVEAAAVSPPVLDALADLSSELARDDHDRHRVLRALRRLHDSRPDLTAAAGALVRRLTEGPPVRPTPVSPASSATATSPDDR
jgi:hypothetical protein